MKILYVLLCGILLGFGLGLGWQISEPTIKEPLTVQMNVSAYCPCEKCCGEYADGVTASGHKIQAGDRFVAAPKSYAFGTMMNIPGYGRVPVLDRGGAIKDNKLDVFFGVDPNSDCTPHEKALQWGRQQLQVTIYEVEK